MKKQNYGPITKRSAEDLANEGIRIRYVHFGESTESEDRVKVLGSGRNYTEAFGKLMTQL
ncbi:hypothetical protein FJZ21_01915 [Candidatus Pacearchaeota archaeon]|nr:hypothetical protein [Candidatus Pacearchaeota archaeon]